MDSTRNSRIVARTVLFGVVVALLLLLLPIWSYNHNWNYFPSLGLMLVLAILATVFFRVTPRHL